MLVKQDLIRTNVMTLEHPPYSYNLALADFYLFPCLKLILKGQRDKDNEDVIANTTKQLKGILKNGFQECFQKLYEIWQKCVAAKRNCLMFM